MTNKEKEYVENLISTYQKSAGLFSSVAVSMTQPEIKDATRKVAGIFNACVLNLKTLLELDSDE